MRYERPEAGQWVQPVRHGYKMACCDCGLVHNLDFRIYRKRVQFRAFRNERSTALMRRHKKEKTMKKTACKETKPATTPKAAMKQERKEGAKHVTALKKAIKKK